MRAVERISRLFGRKSHSGRSFFPITPPVCRLDVVWMAVSPCSSHSFRILVVRNDVVVVSELLGGRLTHILQCLRITAALPRAPTCIPSEEKPKASLCERWRPR